MTMTLTEFLLERVAEDERHARKLAESDRRPVLSLAVTVNHPARVLAECEAKRRIVNAFREVEAEIERAHDPDYNDDAWTVGYAAGLGAALADLALPYADHDDYDARWKP